VRLTCPGCNNPVLHLIVPMETAVMVMTDHWKTCYETRQVRQLIHNGVSLSTAIRRTRASMN
jgi:hypothetical protein